MKVYLRNRKPKDYEFVFRLFYEHKAFELKTESWPEKLKLQLITPQFDAFENSIKSGYPNREDQIIVLNKIPVGRIILNRTQSELNMLYLAILSEFQSQGIAKLIIKQLIIEAEQNQKAFTLKVAKNNPANNLYRKLGFSIIHEDEIKYTLKYES